MKRTKVGIVESKDGRFVNVKIGVVVRRPDGSEIERFAFVPEEEVEDLFGVDGAAILAAWRPMRDAKVAAREAAREAKRQAAGPKHKDPKIGTHRFTPGKTANERALGKHARHEANVAAKAQTNREMALRGGSAKKQ